MASTISVDPKMSAPSKLRHLVLGGAKSGKSRYAESLVSTAVNKFAGSAVYLATATAVDKEMRARIARHREDRTQASTAWKTIEEPIAISDHLADLDAQTTVLIDCLTLWLSNCLHQQCWPKQKERLFAAIDSSDANLIFVSNEISMGVVPLGELTRQYVDEIGLLHQQLAAHCNQVTLMVAGLPTKLK